MLSGVRVPDESPAPLAQLVEQMTLNHWVRGSSPRRCTKRRNQNGFVFFCTSSGTRTTFARRRGVPSPSAYGCHLPRFNGGAYPEGAPNKNKTNLDENSKFILFFYKRLFRTKNQTIKTLQPLTECSTLKRLIRRLKENFLKCKIVNEILIVFQKNFRKCGKSLF